MKEKKRLLENFLNVIKLMFNCYFLDIFNDYKKKNLLNSV